MDCVRYYWVWSEPKTCTDRDTAEWVPSSHRSKALGGAFQVGVVSALWDIFWSGVWSFYYRSEGKWIVRSRGIVAIIFIVLILGLALNSLVIDPIYETNEVPVKTSASRGNPGILLEGFNINVIVVRPINTESIMPRTQILSGIQLRRTAALSVRWLFICN